MLGDHERGQCARGALRAHPFEDRRGQPVTDRHVAALAVLPDVVQERAQQDSVPLLDEAHRDDLHGVVHVGRGERARRVLERPKQMHVDRVAVIRVALRAAPDVGPLGDRADEQSGPIERPQSVHRRWSSAEHPQERLAARLIPRERFRGDGLHRVQLGRGWLPTSLGQRGDQRERLARIGQVDGDRRTVRPDPADDDIVGERIHVARVLEDGAHQAVGR